MSFLKRAGLPRPIDLLAALSLSLFVAGELRVRITATENSGATIRYLQEPWIVPLHNAAFVVWSVGIIAGMGWVIRPLLARYWAAILVGATWLSWVLIWADLLYTPTVIRGRPYNLSELPVSPVLGFGIVGASLMLGYLILRVPTRSRKMIWPKLGLALSAALIQGILWQRWFALWIP